MQEGLVLSVVGGFAEVSLGESPLRCRLRGRLRSEGIMPGDRVLVRMQNSEGVVEEILPRKNVLKRPPVANVDQALIIFTHSEPPLNLDLVDRLTVQVTYLGIRVVLLLNKIDLMEPHEIDQIKSIYGPTGFPFFAISALKGWGIEAVRSELGGRASVMAGESGVGKSRLLNSLDPSLGLRTRAVSQKTFRGRHTTRRVEFLLLDEGGIVADTPGFSRLDLEGISPESLGTLYPEIARMAPHCRFHGCRHLEEPECAVREGVGSQVASERYASYRRLLEDILKWERRRYE